MDDETTHFGYQTVPKGEKAQRVAGVFSSVASRYDLMNDLMSLGMHRLWKAFAVELTGAKAGDKALDVAGGTGDLALALSKRVGAEGRVVLTDINLAMLERGRDRMLDRGLNVPALQCDAEKLPFHSDSFDCVTIGFGLRNVTHKELALAEMLRVLRPGGRLVVLEFSHIWKPLEPLYDVYSFKVLPWLGQRVAQDADSYRYLAESIRMHPDQDTLKELMERAGLERVEYFNLSAGIVAAHRGYKL